MFRGLRAVLFVRRWAARGAATATEDGDGHSAPTTSACANTSVSRLRRRPGRAAPGPHILVALDTPQTGRPVAVEEVAPSLSQINGLSGAATEPTPTTQERWSTTPVRSSPLRRQGASHLRRCTWNER